MVRDVSTICEPIKRKNSIFLEAGGNGVIFSVNYERKFFSKKNNNFLAVKGGLGYFAIVNIMNATLTYNIGDGMNFFEVGGGAGVWTYGVFNSSVSENYSYGYFTPTLGNRRQSARGFLLRTFATFITIREKSNTMTNNNGNFYYEDKINYSYYPFFGISVGYSF